jgi:hypothetical protein
MTTRLVWDIKQNRPACELLQAAFKADTWSLRRYFPAGTWLVYPTPDMRIVEGTDEEWKQIAERFNPKLNTKTP